MKPLDWLAAGVLAAAAVIGVFQLPKFWRNEQQVYRTLHEKFHSFWPLGEGLWHGYIRALPIGLLGLILAVLSFLALALGRSVPLLAPLGFFLFFPLFALTMLIGVGVVFLNWPKFVVAPHLRSQPGAVQEWYETWQQRKVSGKPVLSAAFWQGIVGIVLGIAAVVLAIKLGIVD